MPWKFSHEGVDYLVSDRWTLLSFNDERNIMSEIRSLGDRHPKDVFGEDVPLGEISFTDWEPDTCSCKHMELQRLDSDRRGVGEKVPHKVMRHCEAHEKHANDPVIHHGVLVRESQHKNHAVHEHAEKHGIEDKAEISFAYDDKRQLVISHPSFGKKTIPQPKAN